VKRLSYRYIDVETVEQEVAAVRRLNDEGKRATLDVLAEEVVEEAHAEAVAAQYVDALQAIENAGLDSNVSVKLTGFGLRLLELGSYVGIATHDEERIEEGLGLVSAHELRPDVVEFQMLLGVREARASQLVEDGHRLRVYVPFGSGYAYSLRRLQENPKMAGYVATDVFNRLVPERSPE
jgi:proline dehydrogenase